MSISARKRSMQLKRKKRYVSLSIKMDLAMKGGDQFAEVDRTVLDVSFQTVDRSLLCSILVQIWGFSDQDLPCHGLSLSPVSP